MVSPNLGLQMRLVDYERTLDKLKQEVERLNKQIDECVDYKLEEKYKARKHNVFDEITEIDRKIHDVKQQIQEESVDETSQEVLLESVLGLLEEDDTWLSDIQKAYQATVAHWPTFAPKEMQSLSSMMVQLGRMGQCEAGYSALESFIAHLFKGTESLPLMTVLTQWGIAEGRTYDWPGFYRQIQDEWTAKVKNYKPAILIRIESAQEVATQSANKPHYRLEAWLLEDLETYQSQGKQRTGYRPLISAGTPAAEPFTLENLDAKLQPLLDNWLKETRQLLVNCQNDPEFYVFLPMALLPLTVDVWPLGASEKPKCLGHSFTVILCCSDLFYENLYPIQDWNTYWEKHETSLGRQPHEVFLGGDHQDVDGFLDALDASEDADSILGWKVESSPCGSDVEALAEEFKDFFEELLIKGLPLAIWGRCQEAAINNAQELDKLLRRKTLGDLPRTVRDRRSRARNKSPDCDIGHHLSLLRNNPRLIPPSAPTYRSD